MVLSPAQYIPGTVADMKIQPRKRGNQRTRHRIQYKDRICAFDIETTRLTGAVHPRFAGIKGENERSIMYVWQFHFHNYATIVGRTWEECSRFFLQLSSELGEDEALVIWVHNLSYEFQFLRAIYDFQPDEVFAVKSRKILKCTMYGGKLEFRCSYLHSNMGLDTYTRKMKVEHTKLSGADFNYDIIRYPWTPLSPSELAYCIHDVIGLCEALAKEMEIDKDNLYTIPLTSTGYVRRDVKKAMQRPYTKSMIQKIFPTESLFTMLRESFRGGNTHANRYFTGRVLSNVHSMDRSSSYPDVQCNELYPIGPFQEFGEISTDDLHHLIVTRKKAVVVRLAMSGLRLEDQYEGCPYISLSQCRNVVNPTLDNGRVLSADYLEITVTDIDLKIILSQYSPDDTRILSGAYAQYGKLPKEMVECICGYYKDKTSLKGVPGMEIYYDKSKNKLNAIYGMTATNPAKDTIEFRADTVEQFVELGTPLQELLSDAKQRAFLSYAWGTWCTAHARACLQAGIDLVQSTPGCFFIYCDTDSVKYLGTCDISAFNASRISKSKKSGAFATDPQGVTHYMGVFEQERDYYQFATLGAKKYAFRYTRDGGTLVTIAGVTKSKGGAELDRGDKYGSGLERFCDTVHPFTFHEAGGTEILYHDDNAMPIELEGHTVQLPPCAVIRPSTYTLGLTAEYAALVDRCALPGDFWGYEN